MNPTNAIRSKCRFRIQGNGQNDNGCMDIDECSTFTHSCHADSDCTNTMGSYDCNCKDGFTGDGLICIDIDECKVANLDCHFDATESVPICSRKDF